MASKTTKNQWVLGEKTKPITDFYDLGAQIGQPGQFGYARLVTLKSTKEVRACKVIAKSKFMRHKDRDYFLEQLRGEIDVMKKVSHKHIIKMHDVFEDDNDLYIVMELCTGGELFDRISERGQYSEADAAKVLKEIFEGLSYLHSNKIAHCDLKPDNFLFLTKKDDSPIKIIDFGMAKFVGRRQYFNSLVGTPYYVAPEVIQGKYSEHCDLWSMGVVMFVMLFGFPPFHSQKTGSEGDKEIFHQICKGFDPTVRDGYGAFFPKAMPVSEAARELMMKLLTQDTAKRFTAAEALEHSWFAGKADTKPLVSGVLTNLTSFTKASKFRVELLKMMTDQLDDTDLASLKKTFEAIDENGDKVITVAELKKAIEKFGGEKKDMETIVNLMKTADVDGDGALSYDELIMTCVQRKLLNKEERLWQTFCKLDQNGDGKISKQEIEAALGKGKADELIKEVDKNGDGIIDYDEFLSVWERHEEKKAGIADKKDTSKDEKSSSTSTSSAAAAKTTTAATATTATAAAVKKA